MSAHDIRDTKRPDPDQVLVDIADYVMNYDVTKSNEAMETARYCLMDTLGCGLLALSYPACTALLLNGHVRLRFVSPQLSCMHQGSGPRRSRCVDDQWGQSPWYFLRIRPRARCIQHWRNDSLVGLQ